MSRPTGPGLAMRRLNPPALVIYNFDIDGAQLKPEHRTFLAAKAAPPLRQGGSVAIIGIASRSGSAAHNDRLSMRRALNTHRFLRSIVPNGFAARQVSGFGERVAADQGQRDRTEDERMRAVVLILGTGPVPPMPPPAVDLGDLPLPTPPTGVLDTLTKILDGVGFGAGLVEIPFAVGTLEVITGGFIAALAETVGACAGIASTALSLPAAWLTADRLARFNGACQGYWDAMQDMANAYANPELDSTPELLWPPVVSPLPHRIVDPQSTLQHDLEFRSGQAEGCRLAFRSIMDMEATPLVRFQVIHGQRREIRLSGRMFLRVLRYTYGRSSHGVADAIRAEFNRRLRASGRSEWPVLP